MTVEVQVPFNAYVAAPGATVFTYEFKIVSPADLICTIDGGTPLKLGVDYSLSGVGSNDGGDLTLFVPLAGAEIVLLKLQMTFNRLTDYQQNGDFNAVIVNNDFDRLWLALQQLGQDLKRSIKVPFTETTDQTVTVSSAARANKALVFDASGNITASADNYNDQAADAAASALAAQAAKNATLLAASDADADRIAADLSAQAAAASAASINPANLMHLTGNEVAAGVKTFSDPPIIPTQAATDDSTKGASTAFVQARVAKIGGFKNILINGDFRVNQRGYVSGTNTGGANQYTLDRWRVVTSGQNLTYAASGNGLAVTAPAGGLEQTIEGANIVGGTYVASWIGAGTFKVNGVAATKGATFTLPSNTNAVIQIVGAVAKLQVELGSRATDFEERPYGVELAMCQRYYLLVPYTIEGYAAGANFRISNPLMFPTQMRVTPTRVRVVTGTHANIRSSDPTNYVGLQNLTSSGCSPSVEAASVGYTTAVGFIDSLSAEL